MGILSRRGGDGPTTAVAVLVVALAIAPGTALSACSTPGPTATGAGAARARTPAPAGLAGLELQVLTVDNPQMTDLATLTETVFTPATGIRVRFDVRPENELRRAAAAELREREHVHDVISLGSYDLQVFADAGLLRPAASVLATPGFDPDDLVASIRRSVSDDAGTVWGVPFYAESSMLMYNRDAVAAAGLTVPARPTWPQVAALAARLDGVLPGMRGICLRALPGWGQMTSPLMTVVNTFGGTLFDEHWRPRLTDPDFVSAVRFYLDLIRAHGIAGAPQAGYTECLRAMGQGRVALWYDSTAAAGLLEDPAVSPVAGRVGYAAAPVLRTDRSGWLWTWAWAQPDGADAVRSTAADAFEAWAGSKDYEDLVGRRMSWSRVPSGKRRSTYLRPEYARLPFAQETLQAISTAPVDAPGVQRRPYTGIQFVPVPEFAALGTTLSQQLDSVLVGGDTLDAVLRRCQHQAESVGARYAASGAGP